MQPPVISWRRAGQLVCCMYSVAMSGVGRKGSVPHVAMEKGRTCEVKAGSFQCQSCNVDDDTGLEIGELFRHVSVLNMPVIEKQQRSLSNPFAQANLKQECCGTVQASAGRKKVQLQGAPVQDAHGLDSLCTL